jgi:hypothetical protein
MLSNSVDSEAEIRRVTFLRDISSGTQSDAWPGLALQDAEGAVYFFGPDFQLNVTSADGV